MLGDKLKKLRIEHNLTQTQLGKMIGVSGAYIQQLEKGTKRNPSILILMNLEDSLDTNIRILLEDDPELWEHFLNNTDKYYQHRIDHAITPSDKLTKAFELLVEFDFQIRGASGESSIKIFSDGNLYVTTTKENLINSYEQIIEKIKPFIRYTIESELNKLKNPQI